MDELAGRRDLIDRKTLAAQVAALAEDTDPQSVALPTQVLELLKQALADGRAEIQQRFEAGASGQLTVKAGAFLIDQLIRVVYDLATGYVFQATNPTASERLSLIAVGGYGRSQMAPFSDVDLLFLLPYKQTPWGEQVVEFTLYMLWDLGLKVGHAVRSVDECLRLATADLTIRTALLEARYLWGDQALFGELKERFDSELAANTGPQFIEAKLAERDQRHLRVGDSRYVLEPNVKEGKGGLRDLQTLYWIAKYVYRVEDVRELIEKGVFSGAEYKRFAKAEEFLFTIRCHLHFLTGRPEERLTFDTQPALAERLNYTNRAGLSGVERFMKRYFLVAKDVGDLTRIFCAAIEDQNKRKRRFRFPRIGLKPREIDGFRVDGDRLNTVNADDFAKDPAKMIALFHTAHSRNLDIHPQALRQITRYLKRINQDLRNDADANRLFLELLTHERDPEAVLRWMNEAGVMGRFIPDFGRVVAQMQHDMYHVYTVDEHTIRAIGLLAKIESGLLADDHPLSAVIIKKIKMRRVLYVAVFLHDIAKGRGGDHSALGEQVALELCPRLGMEAAETETVAWLVRWHLAMSNTAFKRDLDDPKTISDFVELVQSPERLKLLLVLTVADIRAVGPNVWNGWKGQLLRDLYYRTEEFMLGGYSGVTTEERAEGVRQDLRARLAKWSEEEIAAHFRRGTREFWLSADLDTHVRWAEMIRAAAREEHLLTVQAKVLEFQSVTELTVYTADHAGLFTRLAGALTLSGAGIVDARIFTTNEGMALDVFWIQGIDRKPISDAAKLSRIRTMIERVLHGEIRVREELSKRRGHLPSRARVFTVEPLVIIDNDASDTHTVVEVNGRDRPALLHDLTRAFFDLSLSISSARIATYGERAVDVFYVKDTFGLKITHQTKLAQIRARLSEALATGEEGAAAASAAQ